MDIDENGVIDMIDAALVDYCIQVACVPGSCTLPDPIGSCDVSAGGVYPEPCYLTSENVCTGWAGGTYVGDASCIPPCNSVNECASVDEDLIRDDNCIWWECDTGSCLDTPLTQFADMGGAFGACPPDTFANIHDKNHALSCFAGTNPCDPINIDAGGAFGVCPPDGFCNIHDANHALSAFAGTSTCSCPSGPLPEFDPTITGSATLFASASRRVVNPGSNVQVRFFVDGPIEALRSYQLDAIVTGGEAGVLELVEIVIEDRKNAAFIGRLDDFSAFNTSTGQMLSGLEANDGVVVQKERYLATFTYKASKDASGTFVVDVHDQETFLIAPDNGQIVVEGTEPAVIIISSRR
jgi:hypothetical protein